MGESDGGSAVRRWNWRWIQGVVGVHMYLSWLQLHLLCNVVSLAQFIEICEFILKDRLPFFLGKTSWYWWVKSALDKW